LLGIIEGKKAWLTSANLTCSAGLFSQTYHLCDLLAAKKTKTHVKPVDFVKEEKIELY